MSSIRNIFGGGGGVGGPLGNIMGMFQKFRQFAQNPLGALLGMNIDIPQQYRNDPQSMVNYLRSSGQMTPDQFDQFSQTANQLKDIFGKGM